MKPGRSGLSLCILLLSMLPAAAADEPPRDATAVPTYVYPPGMPALYITSTDATGTVRNLWFLTIQNRSGKPGVQNGPDVARAALLAAREVNAGLLEKFGVYLSDRLAEQGIHPPLSSDNRLQVHLEIVRSWELSGLGRYVRSVEAALPEELKTEIAWSSMLTPEHKRRIGELKLPAFAASWLEGGGGRPTGRAADPVASGEHWKVICMPCFPGEPPDPNCPVGLECFYYCGVYPDDCEIIVVPGREKYLPAMS